MENIYLTEKERLEIEEQRGIVVVGSTRDSIETLEPEKDVDGIILRRLVYQKKPEGGMSSQLKELY